MLDVDELPGDQQRQLQLLVEDGIVLRGSLQLLVVVERHVLGCYCRCSHDCFGWLLMWLAVGWGSSDLRKRWHCFGLWSQ